MVLGLVVNATAKLTFPQPASGVVSAATWTLTLATKVKVPETHGFRLVFPASTTGDGVSVHTQRGNTTKLPASVKPAQHTFYLSTTNVALAFFEAGTTLNMALAYEQPITRVFNQSTAYGPPEDLYGIESLYIDSARGDKVGFEMAGDLFKNQLAVLTISAGLLAKPVVTPIGTFFTMPPGGVIQLGFLCDKDGIAKSPAIPAPKGVKVWLQSVMINATTNQVQLSDAAAVEIK